LERVLRHSVASLIEITKEEQMEKDLTKTKANIAVLFVEERKHDL